MPTCRENFQLFLSLLNYHWLIFYKQNHNFYDNPYCKVFDSISLWLLLYCLPSSPLFHCFNFCLESISSFVVFSLFFFPILISSFGCTYFCFSSNFSQIKKVKHNYTISMTLEREHSRNEKAKQASWVWNIEVPLLLKLEPGQSLTKDIWGWKKVKITSFRCL